MSSNEAETGAKHPELDTSSAEVQLTTLLAQIGAESYASDLEVMHRAGFRGMGRLSDFPYDVANDLSGLVCSTLVEGVFTQTKLEESIQGGKPWGTRFRHSPSDGSNGSPYYKRYSPRGVTYAIIRQGLIDFYHGPGQTAPTFQERKAARVALNTSSPNVVSGELAKQKRNRWRPLTGSRIFK